jgi:hypothetical protein
VCLQASKAFYDNKGDLLQLWVHETFRVVGDRMWDPADVMWLRKQIDERLSSTFSTNFATLFEDFNEEVWNTALAAVCTWLYELGRKTAAVRRC